MDRVFEHVVPAVDVTRFLALGERRAVAGRCVERSDARAGGADAFGQVPLRNELELDVTLFVEPVEYP